MDILTLAQSHPEYGMKEWGKWLRGFRDGQSDVLDGCKPLTFDFDDPYVIGYHVGVQNPHDVIESEESGYA